ncbi:MAG: hypothetical protein WAN58_02895, partial [Anaerolineales bacterium]
GQGKSTPAVSKHSTALCSGISKARLCKVTVPFSQKNPNGFPHRTKSQQGTRTFRNANYDR